MSALPPLDVMLWCVLALLATGVAAIVIGRNAWARWPVYCACLAISGIACAFALLHLIVHPATAWETVLPLGLPWIGAHFRIDALAAFFLVVINLGAAAASLYGLGYGRHESAPARVLPFFPFFLSCLNQEHMA